MLLRKLQGTSNQLFIYLLCCFLREKLKDVIDTSRMDLMDGRDTCSMSLSSSPMNSPDHAAGPSPSSCQGPPPPVRPLTPTCVKPIAPARLQTTTPASATAPGSVRAWDPARALTKEPPFPLCPTASSRMGPHWGPSPTL